MTTESIRIQSPHGNLPEPGARRIRVRRRPAAALAPRQDGAGARVLRRWSVADLIARAGGAPRAIA